MKNRPIERLRNIGHVTAYDLKEVGIPDEKTLRELGAVVAFQRLKGLRPRHYTIVGLWALAGALNDCPWNQLPPDVKKKLDADFAKSDGAIAPPPPKPVAKPAPVVVAAKPAAKTKAAAPKPAAKAKTLAKTAAKKKI